MVRPHSGREPFVGIITMKPSATLAALSDVCHASADTADHDAWNYLTPYVAVTDGLNEVTFAVTLPHVKAEDVNLAFIGGVLTLRAWCTVPSLDSTQMLTGLYFRRFGLADAVDRSSINAHFSDGMLRITLAYLREKPQKTLAVSVQSAA
jgi:HSP20 family molecular chaperone IbpA